MAWGFPHKIVFERFVENEQTLFACVKVFQSAERFFHKIHHAEMAASHLLQHFNESVCDMEHIQRICYIRCTQLWRVFILSALNTSKMHRNETFSKRSTIGMEIQHEIRIKYKTIF